MSVMSLIAITPFKAYAALTAIAVILAVGWRNSSDARLLSALASFAAFMLIYVFVDAGHFQDYTSYLSWLKLADVRFQDHMDKGFGLLMVILSALSTSPWIFVVFVPLAIGLINATTARLLGANMAIFFLLILLNPRVHEFVFNSTRAALSISVMTMAYVLWISGLRMAAVLAVGMAFSFHMVIGAVCFCIMLLGYFSSIWLLFAIFAAGSVFLIFGIYPEPLYAWPREQLTEFVLFVKGDAVDEYLFESIEGGLWMRFSLWLYCATLAAYGVYLYRALDEKGQLLIKAALAANGAGLIFMSLVPIIARVHLLALLLAGLALARSTQSREGRLDLLMIALLCISVLSTSKNLSFVSLI